MVKKEWIVALILLLLIPVVIVTGGFAFSLINPEIAAGHPNYTANWRLLNDLRMAILWGSFLVSFGLFLLACLMVIRSKKRSTVWLLAAILGPLGFAVLAMLDDCDPAPGDVYAAFVRRMNWLVRIGYEVGCFAAIWCLAVQGMILKHNLMVWYQSMTTGMSTAQILDIQNASSGMWAFSEGNEVMFFSVVLYVLRPFLVRLVARMLLRKKLELVD